MTSYNDERRPETTDLEAADAYAGSGAPSGYPKRPVLRGHVRIDLRRALRTDTHAADRMIQEAAHAPTGCGVTFLVARGQYAPPLATAYLRHHGRHLGSVTVECDDPVTIGRWMRTLDEGVSPQGDCAY